MEYKNRTLISLVALGLSFQFGNAFANQTNPDDYNKAFDFFTDTNNGWSQFAYESDTGNLYNGDFNNPGNEGTPDGVIGPGGGGQAFDTEYLFYKYDAQHNNLTIGLQTGFDVVDGRTDYNGKAYYAGDLALSFDGHAVLGDENENYYANTYEYAVDFGLYTEDGTGETIESYDSGGRHGVDEQGFYRVGQWDNDISSPHSSPFAMDWSDDEKYEVGLIENSAGGGLVDENQDGIADGLVDRKFTEGQNMSYWRIVTFNLDTVVDAGETFTVDAHWTMSCGNDNINGTTQLTRNSTTNVPEPSALALFGIGALGLGFSGYRRRKPI